MPVAPPVTLDPAWPRPNEQVAACCLALQEPPYLPLRTFQDDDLRPDRPAQADPLLPVLAALANLPDGWRAVSQLVLSPASPRWSKPYRRMSIEPPLYQERRAQEAATETAPPRVSSSWPPSSWSPSSLVHGCSSSTTAMVGSLWPLSPSSSSALLLPASG